MTLSWPACVWICFNPIVCGCSLIQLVWASIHHQSYWKRLSQRRIKRSLWTCNISRRALPKRQLLGQKYWRSLGQLKITRSKNIAWKKFTLVPRDMVCEPDKVFDFVDAARMYVQGCTPRINNTIILGMILSQKKLAPC